MNQEIEKLQKEKTLLQERLKKIDNAIHALQQVCEHNFLYLGRDHNYEYYECTLCGKIIKE